jgi:hypothetical protein
MISVHDKNSIKADCKGDPSKIVREALIKLYGRETMESTNITARGSRIGSVGIPDHVREGIRSEWNI